MPSSLVIKCSEVLADKGLNISFAESATAGRLCTEFAMTEASGKILRGGIVCYEVFVKEQILNVPHSLIENYTPESAEVTHELAEQASKLFNSKITVAITGLTTSGGSETPEKPVGTIFFAIKTPSGIINNRSVFKGSPEEIVLQSVDMAAALIIKGVTSSGL